MPIAVGYLWSQMPNHCGPEASETTITAIQKLGTKDGIEAVKSLKSMKKFIHGTKSQDFKIPLTIKNILNGSFKFITLR